MPIAFSCSCGKKLKARDEFAGRKIKCPACQKLLGIPSPVAAEVSVPAAAGTVLAEASPDVPLARPVEVRAPHHTIPPPPPHTAAHHEKAAVHSTAIAAANPWVDRSLEQTATPWLGDDRERFSRGMDFRDGPSFWPMLVLLLVAAAAAAAVFLWLLLA
jgi:hypothetical protein